MSYPVPHLTLPTSSSSRKHLKTGKPGRKLSCPAQKCLHESKLTLLCVHGCAWLLAVRPQGHLAQPCPLAEQPPSPTHPPTSPACGADITSWHRVLVWADGVGGDGAWQLQLVCVVPGLCQLRWAWGKTQPVREWPPFTWGQPPAVVRAKE